MANQSIYAAFDRMWQHLLAKLNNFVSNDKLTNSLLGLATETYVDNKVASLVDSAPEALDTLNELAAALGNDVNFATTVATQIGSKVDKVDGMGLSSNDYTAEEKNQLATTVAQVATLNTQIGNKVENVAGKGLSTNDYTSADKDKVSNSVLSVQQSLTDDQKTQARTNIGALGVAEISSYEFVTPDDIDEICGGEIIPINEAVF